MFWSVSCGHQQGEVLRLFASVQPVQSTRGAEWKEVIRVKLRKASACKFALPMTKQWMWSLHNQNWRLRGYSVVQIIFTFFTLSQWFLNDLYVPDALWPLWRLSRFVYTPSHPSPHPGAAHASCLRGHPWRICARTLAWCLGRTGNAGTGIRALGRKLWEHQTLFGRRTSKVRWC